MPQIVTSRAPRINTFVLDEAARARAHALQQAEFGLQKQQVAAQNQRYDQQVVERQSERQFDREQNAVDRERQARMDALNEARYREGFTRAGDWHTQGRADQLAQNEVANQDRDLTREENAKKWGVESEDRRLTNERYLAQNKLANEDRDQRAADRKTTMESNEEAKRERSLRADAAWAEKYGNESQIQQAEEALLAHISNRSSTHPAAQTPGSRSAPQEEFQMQNVAGIEAPPQEQVQPQQVPAAGAVGASGDTADTHETRMQGLRSQLQPGMNPTKKQKIEQAIIAEEEREYKKKRQREQDEAKDPETRVRKELDNFSGLYLDGKTPQEQKAEIEGQLFAYGGPPPKDWKNHPELGPQVNDWIANNSKPDPNTQRLIAPSLETALKALQGIAMKQAIAATGLNGQEISRLRVELAKKLDAFKIPKEKVDAQAASVRSTVRKYGGPVKATWESDDRGNMVPQGGLGLFGPTDSRLGELHRQDVLSPSEEQALKTAEELKQARKLYLEGAGR